MLLGDNTHGEAVMRASNHVPVFWSMTSAWLLVKHINNVDHQLLPHISERYYYISQRVFPLESLTVRV